jgi:predicted ATPase/class 3 adenylate cyclase
VTVEGLPEGTLTFLLTDLVGSTSAWESDPELMGEVMAGHDRIVADVVAQHRGVAVEAGRAGDSVLAVFRRAGDAAACALDLQGAFGAERWPEGIEVRIRIALHTGEAALRDGHYYGQPLNRCARLLKATHGGQVLLTRATEQLLVDQLPGGAALLDLGLHKLKDLTRPEHVFQLVDIDRPAEFPRIQWLPGALTNLPVQLTEFIGRDQELRKLLELDRQTRLLTLIGPGGVGKTRLALELASEVLGDYRDGVWLVELGPLSDPILVPQVVAGALTLVEQAGRSVLDTLLERCRDSRLMLLLDNCEHLVGASAELVERLLTSCRQVNVLATSHEPLRIPGEQIWPVPPLRRTEAVELFVQCAARHAPWFRITENNEWAVARICERLDDLPLSIELAAARLPLLPVEEIVNRLDRRFTLLTGGSRTVSARHWTLQAAVDWSHELLTASEKMLFRRLSVFVGRFSLKAAEEVCSDGRLSRDQVFELLSHLVDKSLVLAGEGRYRLLETIRDYGRERLGEARETDQLQRRLASYLLGEAEAREAGQLASWLDRLEEVHDDLRATLGWCADADPELGMELAHAMSTFWQLRGHAAEPRQVVEALLRHGPVDSPLRPSVLEVAGAFAFLHGDFEGAASLLRQALLEARANGDQAAVMQTLNRTGLMAVAQGDAMSAESALQEALSLAQKLGDREQEASSLHQLGLLLGTRGDLAGSRSLLEKSIELRTRTGRRDETSVSLTFAAFAMLLGGDLESARRYIHESLEIGRALKDRRAAWSLEVLACLTALNREFERALSIAGAGSAMHESIGNRPSAAW